MSHSNTKKKKNRSTKDEEGEENEKGVDD